MEITETLQVVKRSAWRAWLRKHHATKREIWLVFYKKASGRPRLPYDDAVEEALCYGWIDTTVKALDADRYVQRFMPRKKGSNWSGPNLVRVKNLQAAGLMTPAGAVHLPSEAEAMAHWEKHEKRRTAPSSAPRELTAALRKNPKAAAFWATLAPGYRRLYGRVVSEAKLKETKARRVAKVVDLLSKGVKHAMG